ncbi:Dihydrofolate synthase @ Folylpolyglutamate synthase [Candidatus Phaeomarinobacter ectocarpi]|uniref:Dihydrofolate synthase/folylpolyglutamate synthase n=1 Tax=Candidatus Phaeomarinibacter ectocarpi TaxID=1458461 RepID=X5MM44_9HYPH|nr:folylpolyglutamate synthase/dihydrofolate synthase family protein [Candidatus Phaeomarinobacter ectocarpi]CDO60055.1 Dihydrofolate synthase @ Folylpolyglutamate synthase [Candidatus Phaeomarinobacter ectocarpi]
MSAKTLPQRQSSDAILDRLTGLHPKLIDLSLGRLERLLGALGNPHLHIPPVIHVAGTNGKGSVVAYLRAMFEAQGLRVHTYTSPHLVKFHERIRVPDPTGKSAPVSEDELIRLLSDCEAANDGGDITFFEITTAAAFLAFSRIPADVTLLEVGLGGRFDATNVIETPRACVITPVSLDHQSFLGDTVGEIAGEKAGILKHGVPAIVAPQVDEALEVIEGEAARLEVPLARFGQEFTAFEEHGRLVFQDTTGLLDLPLPGLRGRHQIANAATAVATARAFGGLDETAIGNGLKQVEWPARMQRLSSGALADKAPGAELWLDGGHNPAASRAIAETLADLEDKNPRPLVLISGMMDSKDTGGFFEAFDGLASTVLTVGIPGQTNGRPADDVAQMAREAGLEAVSMPDIETALERASVISPPPRIVICGSLYLAGEVLARNT